MKQTELHLAGAAWLGLERQRENRGFWRMCFKFEMKKLDP